jgi:hypothetical protein
MTRAIAASGIAVVPVGEYTSVIRRETEKRRAQQKKSPSFCATVGIVVMVVVALFFSVLSCLPPDGASSSSYSQHQGFLANVVSNAASGSGHHLLRINMTGANTNTKMTIEGQPVPYDLVSSGGQQHSKVLEYIQKYIPMGMSQAHENLLKIQQQPPTISISGSSHQRILAQGGTYYVGGDENAEDGPSSSTSTAPPAQATAPMTTSSTTAYKWAGSGGQCSQAPAVVSSNSLGRQCSAAHPNGPALATPQNNGQCHRAPAAPSGGQCNRPVPPQNNHHRS